MMEGRFAFLQLHGNWIPELLLLFFGQDSLNRVHLACESRNGKVGPAVAAGNVLQAAVFAG